MAEASERGNESSDFGKGREFVEKLNDCLLLKKGSISWLELSLVIQRRIRSNKMMMKNELKEAVVTNFKLLLEEMIISIKPPSD